MHLYYAVGSRCAVDLETFSLPAERTEVLALLARKGFNIVEVDLKGLARRCITTSTYRRGARFGEAPEVVDCSSFVKWLYGQRGIWLPRRSIQQREMGNAVAYGDIAENDLVFRSGHTDYYFIDPADGVGHVGIATNEGTVIHAANKAAGIVESPIAVFAPHNTFRGARCIIPRHRHVLTFLTPPEREVETSDDVRWIVLQSTTERGVLCAR